MKKIITLGTIFTVIMLLFSCEELKDPAGLRGKAVVPYLKDVNPAIFDSKDLENSYVQFVVDLPEGATADKIVIEGSYKDNFERVVITELTSFPSTVKIMSADAAQKLGLALGDISNGDIFTFELVTTSKRLTTHSSAVLQVPVACAYDQTLATGSYHSVSSPDWGSDGTIAITGDPDDPYTVYVSGLEAIEGLDEDQGPLPMHINPINYSVVADKTVIASDAWGYHNIAYEGNGKFSSCDGSYSMLFTITVDEGTFGTYSFTFTRN
jgi:hypothetical protein